MQKNSVCYSDRPSVNVSNWDHTTPVYNIPCSVVLFTLCPGNFTPGDALRAVMVWLATPLIKAPPLRGMGTPSLWTPLKALSYFFVLQYLKTKTAFLRYAYLKEAVWVPATP